MQQMREKKRNPKLIEKAITEKLLRKFVTRQKTDQQIFKSNLVPEN